MSRLILGLTMALIVLPPAAFFAAARQVPDARPILVLGGLVTLLYVWTWLYARPSAFVITQEGLEIIWPLRRRMIRKSDIISAATIDRAVLRQEFGRLLRVGSGGLFGAFGLAWSSKGKHLGLYVSRHRDGFVVVRCRKTRSLLITPERPDAFLRALAL